jgi:hypothetical protein
MNEPLIRRRLESHQYRPADGRFVGVGTGDQMGSDMGTAKFSTDFGNNFSHTSFVNHYMQTLSLNGNGSRMVVRGAMANT